MEILTSEKLMAIFANKKLGDDTLIAFFRDGSWSELEGINRNIAHPDIVLLCDIALLRSIVELHFMYAESLDTIANKYFMK